MPLPTTVDVVDGTGNPAVRTEVTDDLRAGGLTLGTWTPATAAAPSAIEYAAVTAYRAKMLAAALDAASYLRLTDVPHITLVLGPHDSTALLAGLDAFAAAATRCSASPTPTG